MDVRLKTLGTPSVTVNGEEIRTLPGKPVVFGLLVFLALEKEVTRDRALGFLWPDSPQEKARQALSQTIYELRKVLGEEWVESLGNLLKTTPALRVDALEFEKLAADGRHEEAIALYGGHFLEGVHLARTNSFEEWTERQRARLARHHRGAVDAFIKAARERGDVEVALKGATRWAALDPLDDGAQHYLIQLLADSGSRSEALAQYQRYEAMLQEELGLEPLDETRELVEGIRDRTVATPLPKRVEARPLPTPVPKAAVSREQISDRKELAKHLDQELAGSLQILRPIGRGSMADVYLAREPGLKLLVAFKILSARLAADPIARKRFHREAQAAARINHPNVCTVYRVGTLSDGTPYHTSRFVKGTSMAHRLKAEGRLPPEEVRGVVREVASALAAAHKLGIIHRDVCPDNVLLEEETGEHFLCDFGIAGVLDTEDDLAEKLTRTGEILGHPDYISPEQMTGDSLTDRSDIYGLGVMAHKLLTGHPPPPGDKVIQRPGRTVPLPDLGPLREYLGASDPDLVDLIARCLAINPTERPSAADISRKCEERKAAGEAIGLGTPDNPGDPVRALFDRRLPQILGAYVAAAWLTLEFTQYMVAHQYLPGAAERLVLMSVPFGFLAVTILGWFHGKKGRQTMPALEKWLLAGVGWGWGVGVGWVMGS